MPYKDKDKQNECNRRTYHRNKTINGTVNRVRANNLKYIERNKAIVSVVKQQGCTDCKQHYPDYVLQFDHTGTDKINDVSAMANNGYSVEALKKEIAKCEVVCANCHAVRTYDRAHTT